MCKHVVLIPIKSVDTAMQKKTCKPIMFSRVWLATRRALSLEHSSPQQFGCCQWQPGPRPSVAYLVYRWLLFIAVASTGIACFVCQRLPRNYKGAAQLNHMKWFIYLTNWGYMLLVLQCGLALILVHRYRTERNLNISIGCEDADILHRRRTPFLCKFYWLTHSIATDLAFVITLVYWIRVHDPDIHEVNTLNVLVHGGNTLVMLSELVVTAHPVRAAHALYGACAGLTYGVFSAVYWACGGTDRLGHTAIYPSLDWGKPGSALGFVALCACVLVTAHALATALAALRGRIAARLMPTAARGERLTLPTH